MEQHPIRKQPEFRGPAEIAASIFKVVGGIIDPLPHARRIESADRFARQHQDEVIIDLTARVESRVEQARQFEEEITAAKSRHPSSL